MFRRSSPVWIVLILVLLVQLACVATPNIPITGTGGAAETAVYATVGAQATQAAFNTLVAQLTQVAQVGETLPAPTNTNTGVAPSPTNTATPTATPTNTNVPPTATFTNTPVPTSTNTPVPTATPIPCYKVQFVSDVTVADGTTFSPNQSFIKTWRLKNAGSCTWTPDFDLIFVSGNSMGAPAVVDLNTNVTPGQTVDVSVSMVSPNNSGSYTGSWMLRSSSGVIFGLGNSADKAFWVKINVGQTQPSQWDDDHVGDFAYGYCSAVWRTGSGVIGCPSSENFSTGAVWRTNSPRMEGDHTDDEPAIVVIPSGGDGGTVSGTFPSMKVKSGDDFVALVGCMDDSSKCNVTFQVNYQIDGGSVQNLGTWTETSDGNWTHIAIDLDFLADKNVSFILQVNNNGSNQDDRAFWLAPAIK